ncbi:DUF6924 domain-containing protein [Streptomyces fuscigenes]|uniref:DUF6924 domain-containing protein n=1 Tax=Streptomyces fuscigenes TaxID=1528880 RepID=UPI001F3F1B60|nr:hypothetical protein [Streptomyces fuscigenes]MCF3964749.1 hypothetical protein [Streptomyces fuscigenes]
MRTLPKTDEDYPPLLLVRTDYGDDAGWRRLRETLDHPWVFDERDGENGRLTEEILCVDDPRWEGAGVPEILAALAAAAAEGGGETAEDAECGWAVVFVADAAGVRAQVPTLLAVSPDPEETTEPYRIPALETPHAMHCNLALANMDFQDFSGELSD